MQLLNTSLPRTSTTDMEVTSIRLERELKERLKELADKQGYQALIRDILWDYVQKKTDVHGDSGSRSQIRASVAAIAQKEEQCWLTGRLILPNESMLLGWTTAGDWVPLSRASLEV